MANFILFALYVGAIFFAVWLLTYGKSIYERDKYLLAVSAVRDDLEDDVLFGRLPDVDCVWFWHAKAEALLRHVDHISFSAFAAFVSVAHHVEMNGEPEPAHFEMSNVEIQRLDGYEERLVEALAQYIRGGSRLWFLIPISGFVMKSKRLDFGDDAQPQTPHTIAQSVSRAMDDRQSPFGKELLAH